MKYLKTFETYTFEDFTHADIEDVKDLLDEGLTIKIHIPAHSMAVLV